jgi:hypothetical protein
MLSGIDPEAMAVEPALVLSIQVSFGSILTIHFHVICLQSFSFFLLSVFYFPLDYVYAVN